jgi:hypothetical protein
MEYAVFQPLFWKTDLSIMHVSYSIKQTFICIAIIDFKTPFNACYTDVCMFYEIVTYLVIYINNVNDQTHAYTF